MGQQVMENIETAVWTPEIGELFEHAYRVISTDCICVDVYRREKPAPDEPLQSWIHAKQIDIDGKPVGNFVFSDSWKGKFSSAVGQHNVSFCCCLKEAQRTHEEVKAEIQKAKKAQLPTRDQVTIDTWEERDRLHIGVVDNKTGNSIADWWDDSAREMFEDGFFKPADFVRNQRLEGRKFEESVLDYMEEMGMLRKE